jgi:anti-anti-sigma regulatory factor
VVVVDVTRCTFVDSTILAAILADAAPDVTVVGAVGEVRRLFEITGMERYLA